MKNMKAGLNSQENFGWQKIGQTSTRGTTHSTERGEVPAIEIKTILQGSFSSYHFNHEFLITEEKTHPKLVASETRAENR